METPQAVQAVYLSWAAEGEEVVEARIEDLPHPGALGPGNEGDTSPAVTCWGAGATAAGLRALSAEPPSEADRRFSLCHLL